MGELRQRVAAAPCEQFIVIIVVVVVILIA